MQLLVDRPDLATKRERLLALLRTLAFQEREVVLSSGRKSNFYIDCKQVSLDAEGATLIGELFHVVIDEIAPHAVAVGGLTLGADPLATATSIISFQRGRPRAAFLVRKEPKGHGTNQWLESTKLAAGAPVVRPRGRDHDRRGHAQGGGARAARRAERRRGARSGRSARGRSRSRRQGGPA